LTPDHCELLWKMAEEPILCFDGDRAGRKAAYRAIDMALPLIGPGRSLSFAFLPEGCDPDDLVRSGGRQAVSALLAAVLPLAEVIWIRETENKIFATPERRAGLERRLNEIAREIRDETLRRYYQSDFRARLFRYFRSGHRPLTGGSTPQRQRSSTEPSNLAAAPVVSRSLAESALLSPLRKGIPPREGLILLLLFNHPGLIGRHIEELAEIEFLSPEASALRDALLGYSAAPLLPGQTVEELSVEASHLCAAIEGQGFGPVLQKLGEMAAHASHWYTKTEAAESDAEEVLKQALALQRRTRGLHKELQLAELALVKDTSEANLGRLRDIQAQLSALGGIEAAGEEFGAQSGRPSGTL
jgi:DNA primase